MNIEDAQKMAKEAYFNSAFYSASSEMIVVIRLTFVNI